MAFGSVGRSQLWGAVSMVRIWPMRFVRMRWTTERFHFRRTEMSGLAA